MARARFMLFKHGPAQSSKPGTMGQPRILKPLQGFEQGSFSAGTIFSIRELRRSVFAKFHGQYPQIRRVILVRWLKVIVG
jgi:hypothetical protein